jgi:hypothetical protein
MARFAFIVLSIHPARSALCLNSGKVHLASFGAKVGSVFTRWIITIGKVRKVVSVECSMGDFA